MKARFKLMERTAKSLESDHSDLYTPSLKVKALLKRLGIRVVERDLDTVSGAAIVEDGKQVILVNKDHSETRKRFTVAHELGHILLHRDKELSVDYSTDDPVFLRDQDSSTGDYWREVEANGFAATLLMPESLVKKEIRILSKKTSDDDELTEMLADRFKVSKESMSIRRKKLGF